MTNPQFLSLHIAPIQIDGMKHSHKGGNDETAKKIKIGS